MLIDVALVLAAYLCGSIATAILVSRLMGLPDPRHGGSGNPGATNVLRLGGKKAAVLTLAGDVLKGWIPVAVAAALGRTPAMLAAAALAAFLGHLFPIFFGFRGGKGVATALGALAGVSWGLGLLLVATWLAVAALSRYSSLAAVVTAVLAPLYALWIPGGLWAGAGTAVMSALLLWRHRENIGRLRAGTEDKIGARSRPRSAGAGSETGPLPEPLQRPAGTNSEGQ